jgi:hypothetical protein
MGSSFPARKNNAQDRQLRTGISRKMMISVQNHTHSTPKTNSSITKHYLHFVSHDCNPLGKQLHLEELEKKVPRQGEHEHGNSMAESNALQIIIFAPILPERSSLLGLERAGVYMRVV